MPSVSTLYTICAALGISTDGLVTASTGNGTARPPVGATNETASRGSKHLRPEERRFIELEHGVRWELLNPSPEPGAEFREVIYAPGVERGGFAGALGLVRARSCSIVTVTEPARRHSLVTTRVVVAVIVGYMLPIQQ